MLDQAYPHSRLFIHHYCIAFTLSFVVLFSLLIHAFLDSSHNCGFFANNIFVPVLLLILSLYSWALLLAKIAFEGSVSHLRHHPSVLALSLCDKNYSSLATTWMLREGLEKRSRWVKGTPSRENGSGSGSELSMKEGRGVWLLRLQFGIEGDELF